MFLCLFISLQCLILLVITVRTQFVMTQNDIGFARKKAQTISFVERGFERLGLVTGRWFGMAQFSESHPRSLGSSMLLLFSLFQGHHGWEDGSSPPLSHCHSYPFIRAFILLPVFTCKLNSLGLKTCPVSPYLEWLGVVEKAEEYGSVRCRVLNGSNGSFSFVLGRYTIQSLLLY